MKRWRAANKKWLLFGAAGVFVLMVAAPDLLLHVGMSKARTCLATIAAPRSAQLPACEALDGWFVVPEFAPWTRHIARLAREELHARMAVAKYVDAAVGNPDRAQLTERIKEVWQAQHRVDEGTGRVRLDQLGPAVPAPDPPQLAFSLGDSGGLDRYAMRYDRWFTSLHAIDAALLSGKLERAQQLAEHYAKKPKNDLRLTVGALLCLGGKAAQGLELLSSVEKQRAESRKANMVRNFGDVRVLIESCAAAGKLAVPEVPTHGYAGDWDHRERLAVLRLRLAEQQHACSPADDVAGCFAAEPVATAARAAAKLLKIRSTSPYRLELVAAVAPYLVDAEQALRLGVALGAVERASLLTPGPRPDPNRAPAQADSGPPAWSMVSFVGPTAPDRPWVSPQRYALAAERLLALESRPNELHRVAGALQVRAARGFAAVGKPDRAWQLAIRGGESAFHRPLERAWIVANVGYLAGQPQRSLDQLSEALRLDTRKDEWALRARLLHTRLLALVGRTAEALTAVKHAYADADSSSPGKIANEPWIEALSWWILALEQLTEKTSARPGAPRQPEISPLRFPWVGPVDSTIPAADRQPAVRRAQAAWRVWLASSSEQRRSYRYTTFNHRGDGPDALVPYLVIAGKLVGQPAHTETWLDALLSFDARRLSLRSYAWIRAEAAHLRSDQEARKLWQIRYRRLAELTATAAYAELYQQLRL